MYKDIVFYVDEIKDKGKNVQRINYVKVNGLVIPFATIEEKKKLKNENGELFEELVDEWQKVLSGKVEPQVIKPEKKENKVEGAFYNLYLRDNYMLSSWEEKETEDNRFVSGGKSLRIYAQYKNGEMIDVITGEIINDGEKDDYPEFELNYYKIVRVSKQDVINDISTFLDEGISYYQKNMAWIKNMLYRRGLCYLEKQNEKELEKQNALKAKKSMEKDFDGYIAKIRKRNK